MASMVAGGLFNAVAFAGAGFLFSKFNKSGYEKQAKRHNLATEELAKAKEKFYEQETKRKDRVAELRAELYIAKSDMKETDKAFSELKEILQQSETIPTLEDFYQPSDEMKKYQIITVGLLGGGGGLLLTKMF